MMIMVMNMIFDPDDFVSYDDSHDNLDDSDVDHNEA